MLLAFKIVIFVSAIWIALSFACALRVARRRRTGASQVVGDPYFYPFGDVPNTGFTDRQLDLATVNYRRALDRDALNRSLDISPSANAPRRNTAAGELRTSPVPSWLLAGRTSFSEEFANGAALKPGDDR